MIRVECWWAWANKVALAGSLVHFVLVSGVCEGGDLGRQECLLPSGRFPKVACSGKADSFLKGVRTCCGISPTSSFGGGGLFI